MQRCRRRRTDENKIVSINFQFENAIECFHNEGELDTFAQRSLEYDCVSGLPVVPDRRETENYLSIPYNSVFSV